MSLLLEKLLNESSVVDQKTPYVLWRIVDECIDEKYSDMSTMQREEFYTLVERKANLLYSHNSRFRTQITGFRGKKYLRDYVDHWLDAYMGNSNRFKRDLGVG